MIDCRFKPIDQWPHQQTPSWKRRKSPFKAGWSQTLDLLEKELNHLKATDIIVDGYFQFRDIRNDGWPKSTARPSQPGVILSFDTKRGRMSMPCDTYTDWEANLRGIALTLEHLRSIERYGVTTEQHEQYTGWLKLPAASPADEATQHAKTLFFYCGLPTDIEKILGSQVEFEQVWRAAVRRTHPDTGGTNSEAFSAVIAARDRLKQLKGWA